MNRTDLLKKLASCSSEDKQLYASLCLRRYCESKGISHPAIDALLDHLDSMASSRSLAEWDSQGALLDLNGRGDPIPDGAVSRIKCNVSLIQRQPIQWPSPLPA
ncbi:hypothetical protein, partial [Burkholderia ubonensis]|uniref:hypothetical protein n=1 Tax=Burkholderia ubonensis TaxID=101571 RepID=UPI001E364215